MTNTNNNTAATHPYFALTHLVLEGTTLLDDSLILELALEIAHSAPVNRTCTALEWSLHMRTWDQSLHRVCADWFRECPVLCVSRA